MDTLSKFTRQQVDVSRLPNTVVTKWSSALLDEGFVPFPKRFLRCLPKILKGEHATRDLAVILAVVDYKRENLRRSPSVEYLAFVAGMELPEFEAGLNRLKEEGLVTFKRDTEGINVSIDGLIARIEKLTSNESGTVADDASGTSTSV